jgi:hypothetical protein
MESPEFPPNSQASKKIPEDKKIERVTTGEVVRKKRPLRKRFVESFVAGDARTVIPYVVMDVLLPSVRDVVVDSIQEFVAKLILGEGRRYRGISSPTVGPYGQQQPYGQVNYTRYSASRLPPAQRVLSRQARARHNFDEIQLTSRAEAEEVIDGLYEVVSRYESATVADLYQLVGLASDHTDHKWGWTDIRGAGVSRGRDGYLLDLPDPIPLGN